jgi:peptidoglycan-associated lipoprotein
MLLAALGVTVAASACSTVKRDEYNAGIAALRDDLTMQIEAGDQAVSTDLGGRIDALSQRVDALNTDLQALEQEFGVTVEKLEAAIRFNVPVYFEFDQAEVVAEASEVLSRFNTIAQEYYPGFPITIEGFTDSSGSAEYNLRLGQRRADAVMGYLVQAGMPSTQVRAVSYGEDSRRLLAAGATGPGTAGWENRRVVMVIDHNGQAPAGAIASGTPPTP